MQATESRVKGKSFGSRVPDRFTPLGSVRQEYSVGGGGEVPRIHQALKEPLKEVSKEGLKKVLSIRGLARPSLGSAGFRVSWLGV